MARHDIGLGECDFHCNEGKTVAVRLSFTDKMGTHKICRTCYRLKTGRTSRVETTIAEYFVSHGLFCSSHDEQTGGAICFKYRPDFVFDMPRVRVIVECDEHQHRGKGGDYTCDEQRMGDIGAERPNIPAIFIRFNPDKYGKAIRYRKCVPRDDDDEEDDDANCANDDDDDVDERGRDLRREPVNLGLGQRLSFLVAHLRWIFAAFGVGETQTFLPPELQAGLSGVVVHYLYYDRDIDNCARSSAINVQFYT